MARFVAVALALATVGCSLGGERIEAVQRYRADPAGYLFAAGRESRDIATIVAGNPFGVAPATLASVVAAALGSAFPGADLRFVTRPDGNTRRDVVYIVVFDAPAGIGPVGVCARQGRVATAPSADAVHATMAFCAGRDALVGIRARLDRTAGLGDQAFVGLLRDMARRMFKGSELRP